MEKKKSLKLILRKEEIANLNEGEMNSVKGGMSFPDFTIGTYIDYYWYGSRRNFPADRMWA